MGNVQAGRDIDAALRKKGFSCKPDGKHLRYSLYLSNGTKTGINTLMSHGMGSSSLSANLIARMARQLRLTKEQFLELIDCTLSEDTYKEILSKAGVIH